MALLDRWSKPKKSLPARTLSQSSSAEATVVKPKEAGRNLNANAVLIRPLITEKTAREEAGSRYVFAVALGATKAAVKLAIEEVYGVKPVAVNIAIVQGRRIRFGKSTGRRSDYKKAIVTLPKGTALVLHEGV